MELKPECLQISNILCGTYKFVLFDSDEEFVSIYKFELFHINYMEQNNGAT